jgi:uncharacterized membrane protein
MKKQVSPVVAIAALVVFLGIAAFVYVRSDRRAPAAAGPGASGTGGMPPQVSAEIKRRLDQAKIARP